PRYKMIALSALETENLMPILYYAGHLSETVPALIEDYNLYILILPHNQKKSTTYHVFGVICSNPYFEVSTRIFGGETYISLYINQMRKEVNSYGAIFFL
ncbi:MAG: hypothetical protein RR791_05580, partial [Lachnospiraceae bacterium]